MFQTKNKISNYILYFIAFYLLFFHQINSLVLLKSISINYIDSLDGITVYKKVIADMYKKDFGTIDILLNGELKWYNLDGVFRPLIIIYILLGFKQAFIFEIFLYKILSFYSFYRLSNKSLKLKNLYAVFISILYAEIVTQNAYMPQSILILFYPYLGYLLFKEKKINLKNFVTLFFIGSNSSIIFELPAILGFCIFFALLNKKYFSKNFFLIIITILFSLFIFNFYLFLNFDGTIYQRSEYKFDQEIGIIFFNTLKNFLFISPHLIEFSFKFIFLCIQFFLLSFSIFGNNSIKLLIIYIFVFFIFILFIKIFIFFSYEYLPDNIRSIQFIRIQRVQPMILLIIFVNFFNSKLIHKKFKNLILIILILGTISFRAQPITENIFRNLVYSNFKGKSLQEIKGLYFDSQYKKIINKIFSLETISFNSYSKLLNFENYYKIHEYMKIKELVGDSVVISYELDPMIAVANNIKSADGYFQLYPITYKNKFRKIIKKELEKNIKLENYFNEFGSRLYLFSHNKKNPDFDYKAMKSLNVRYIISKFNLENNSLSKINMKCCIELNLYILN